MALRAVQRGFASVARPRTALQWEGAVAVGFAALGTGSSLRAPAGVSRAWHNNAMLSAGNVRVTARRFLSTHSSSSLFSLLSSSSTTSQTMANLTPPQPAPVWNHAAEDIVRLTKEAIEHDRAVQDKVGALDAKDANFESVCPGLILRSLLLIMLWTRYL